MKKIFIFIFINSCLFAQDMLEPPSLKGKILSCDLIVVGYVKKFVNNKMFLGNTASNSIIVVTEILKGEYIRQIPIPNKLPPSREQYLHGFQEPLSVVYYIGETEKAFKDNEPVLVFIYKAGNDDYIIIACNQWDPKPGNLSPEEIKIYRKKILEYLNILKISDEKIKKQKEADWILSLCEDPLTIWDGLSNVKSLESIFSYTQKTKIRKIIMSLERINHCPFEMIDFLFEIKDSQVLGNMFELLERQELRESHADLIMGYITYFDSTKSLLKLFYKYLSKCEIRNDKNKNICNKLINEFIVTAKRSLIRNSKRPHL